MNAEPATGRQRALVAVPDGGAWFDAARWFAFWEAVRWAEASWKAQNTAAWQLGWTGRWLQRDADDGR